MERNSGDQGVRMKVVYLKKHPEVKLPAGP